MIFEDKGMNQSYELELKKENTFFLNFKTVFEKYLLNFEDPYFLNSKSLCLTTNIFFLSSMRRIEWHIKNI